MPHKIYLACQPIHKPDWLKGNVVVYRFTAPFVRWILETQQRLLASLSQPAPGCSFHRAAFFVPHGMWLDNVDLHEDVAFDSSWIELDEGWSPPESHPAQSIVASECWTMGIGDSDVLFHFFEKHCDEELETPEITNSDFEGLLARLD